MSNHSAIMNAANALGLTFDGVRVLVAGWRQDYAQVVIADRQHPFYGWQTEYAWPTIERATKNGGILR